MSEPQKTVNIERDEEEIAGMKFTIYGVIDPKTNETIACGFPAIRDARDWAQAKGYKVKIKLS